jgi:hypothetical protein
MESTAVLWAEMGPSEHLVQFYEDDDTFLDTLEGFVADGLRLGESVVVIATAVHLSALNRRLTKRSANIVRAMHSERYLALDAQAMLSLFMVDGWPDEELFNSFVTRILSRSKHEGGRVRAFGEMVAILWAEGNSAATVALERLWTDLCAVQDFMLLCAYPKCGFADESCPSLRQICDSHSRVIA